MRSIFRLIFILQLWCGVEFSNMIDDFEPKRYVWTGFNADTGQWKFVVVIFKRRPRPNEIVIICTGELINEQKVLTAGRCGKNDYKDYHVLAGGFPVAKALEARSKFIRRIHSIKIHDKFKHEASSSSFDPYDLAIFTLDKPYKKNTLYFPSRVRLYEANIALDSPEDNCFLLGYGLEWSRKPLERLQQVKLPILSDKFCEEMSGIDSNRLICAGIDVWLQKDFQRYLIKASKAATGGPLMCKILKQNDPEDSFGNGNNITNYRYDDYGYVMVGVMSMIEIEMNPRSTFRRIIAYFTKISVHLQWIRENSGLPTTMNQLGSNEEEKYEETAIRYWWKKVQPTLSLTWHLIAIVVLVSIFVYKGVIDGASVLGWSWVFFDQQA